MAEKMFLMAFSNSWAWLASAVEGRVWPWIASGQFRPVIDRTFPLARASEAHAALEAGDHVGKIILTCS